MSKNSEKTAKNQHNSDQNAKKSDNIEKNKAKEAKISENSLPKNAKKSKNSAEFSEKNAKKSQKSEDSSVKNAKKSSFALPKINFPTWLTIARIILIIPLMFLIFNDDLTSKILTLTIFVIATISDKLDGDLARSRGEVTNLGKFLDPLADKMLTNLTFLALVAENLVPLWVFALILVRDFAMDGLRMNLAASGRVLPASPLGKWKTTFQMFSLVAILLNKILLLDWLGIIANILLYTALFLTLFSMLDYFRGALRRED